MIFFMYGYCKYISKLYSKLQRHLKHCRVKSEFVFRKLFKSVVIFFHNSNINQFKNHFITAFADFFHDNNLNDVDARRNINDVIASDERFNDAFNTIEKKNIHSLFQLRIEFNMKFINSEIQTRIYEKKNYFKINTRFMIVENKKIHFESRKRFNDNFFSFYNSVDSVLTL